MRTLKSLCVKALAISGLAALSLIAVNSAQAAASASAAATADIIAPIAIINLDPTGLAFGKIVPVAAGTVTIAPDSSRTFAGVEVVPSSAHTAAHFRVTGNAGNTFSITLPASTTISSAGNNMTVNNFTSTPSGVGTLNAGGARNVDVGATLHVGAGQAIGNYVGAFTVTVAYN